MNAHEKLRQTAQKWRKDIYFSHNILGCDFNFTSTWGIFSPEKLDEGSLLLLDYVDFLEDDNSIDLGCGVGVLGMTAAKMCPKGVHYLIDKDFVAVEYAKQNCVQNHLSNTHVQLSNGFMHVQNAPKFSLVMSNLPAKASKEQHYLYLLDAYDAMQSGGRFYVVTINGLKDFMKRSFTEVFGNSKKLKQSKTYTVTCAIKP